MVEALVKFGVKDQNVVLSTMDKIVKKKKDLGKKQDVSFFAKEKYAQKFGVGAATSRFGVGGGLQALKSAALDIGKSNKTAEQKKIDDYKKEQFENSKLVQGAKAAGSALMGIAKGAASLDPVQYIQSFLTAAATVTSGIPFLGGAVQGAAALANVSVGAAGGAVNSAKQNIPAALELEKRNATNNRYGGDLFKSEDDIAREAERRRAIEARNAPALNRATEADRISNHYAGLIEQTLRPVYERHGQNTDFLTRRADTASAVRAQTETQIMTSSTSAGGSGGWTPSDKANFIQSVAASFGTPTKELSATLNKLIGAHKNVEQLTQVASGNWNALGTDEGAILQQITNSFSGALPSVKQALQNELLKQNGSKIESEKDSALANRRGVASTWEQQGERQVRALADAASAATPTLLRLDRQLNEFTIGLVRNAQRLAEGVSTALGMLQ